MQDNRIYPAVFYFEPEGITVTFPDLPGIVTCGDDMAEALYMAKEALELHLYGMEKDGDPIPGASILTDIPLEANERTVLVEAQMSAFRAHMANRAVKKTLTIPQWLNDMAESKHVNFSQILQSALKDYLGVKEPQIK